MRIVFIEDNPDLREEIGFQLGKLGHEVVCLDCGQALLSLLEISHRPPDVLLLDLGLPDIDGLQLAQQIRKTHPTLPIVMLTARGDVGQRVAGWQAGADVYLVKPVQLKELRVVLESLVKRHAVLTGHKAEWALDLQANRLLNPQGESCALSFTECALLYALVRASGEPVERDVLVKAQGAQVWDYDMRRLETAISRLRKKIREMGGDPDMLRPVRGIGYLLAGVLVLRD